MEEKICLICQKNKPISFFRLNKRGNPTFYCSVCGNDPQFVYVLSNNTLIDIIDRNSFFSFSFSNAYFLDFSIVSIHTSSYFSTTKRLIFPKLKKGESIMIQPSGAINIVQTEHAEWFVSDSVAVSLELNVYSMIFTKKQMMKTILSKQNYTCIFCSSYATCAIRIIPEHEGGIFTLSNIQSVCKDCMFEYSPKRIYQWLNVLPADDMDFYLFTKSGKAKHPIKKDFAFLLVEEKMAKWHSLHHIQLLYHIGEFEKYISKRDRFRCYYCRKRGDNIDHKTPKSKGGITSPKNCVYSCLTCNREKADMDFDEYILKMSH